MGVGYQGKLEKIFRMKKMEMNDMTMNNNTNTNNEVSKIIDEVFRLKNEKINDEINSLESDVWKTKAYKDLKQTENDLIDDLDEIRKKKTNATAALSKKRKDRKENLNLERLNLKMKIIGTNNETVSRLINEFKNIEV